MALQKEEILDNGVKLNYHRVTHAQINMLAGDIIFSLSSYIDKESRDNGYEPVKIKPYRIESVTQENILAYSYEFLKQDIMLDAIDC